MRDPPNQLTARTRGRGGARGGADGAGREDRRGSEYAPGSPVPVGLVLFVVHRAALSLRRARCSALLTLLAFRSSAAPIVCWLTPFMVILSYPRSCSESAERARRIR